MTQTADRYGKVLYDLRVPAEDVEQMKACLLYTSRQVI